MLTTTEQDLMTRSLLRLGVQSNASPVRKPKVVLQNAAYH